MKNFENQLKKFAYKFYTNETLKNHTTIKIGGNAKYFVYVNNYSSLKAITSLCKKRKIKLFIIGAGSNLLFDDNGYNGVIIKLCGDFDKITTSNGKIYCGASVNLYKLNIFCYKNYLSGLEWSYGIPATIGGAVYMNAGAYKSEIGDIIESVKIMDSNGKIKIFRQKKCRFAYRKSIFKNSTYIILSIVIYAKKEKDNTKIANLMNFNLQARKDKQPFNYFSAGSVFLKTKDITPALAIERLGIKGFQIGDAQISKIHSGFIVNLGSATCQQVLDLIEYIQGKIFIIYKKLLKLEIIIVKE